MAKVFLRPLAIDDAKTSWEWRNDPAVWEYTGNRPSTYITYEIEKKWIKEVLERENEKRFAICTGENEQYIGNVQLTDINKYSAQLHIFIGEKIFWGKGLGTEATRKILHYGFNELHLQLIYLDVNKNNVNAIKTYYKVGFEILFEFDDYLRMGKFSPLFLEVDVSVFLMSYNHGKLLKNALNGILNQASKFKIQIVVGDDFSTDDSRDILFKYACGYPGKIKLIFYPRNLGAVLNQKWILQNCKGKYIAFCEGDDYWTDKNKLQFQVDFLEKNEEFSLCCHDVFFQFGNKKKRSFQWDAPEVSDLHYLLRRGNYITTLSVVLRNHHSIAEFLHKFENPPLGDYLIYVAAAHLGKIRFFKKRMGVYRVHSGGSWSQLGLKRAFAKSIQVVSALYDVVRSSSQDDLRIQFLAMLESVTMANHNDDIGGNQEMIKLMKKMNIEPFMVEYIKHSVNEKKKSSYYSKNIPVSLLINGLKEKLKNRIPRI